MNEGKAHNDLPTCPRCADWKVLPPHTVCHICRADYAHMASMTAEDYGGQGMGSGETREELLDRLEALPEGWRAERRRAVRAQQQEDHRDQQFYGKLI